MCSLQERGIIMKISTKGRYALRVMIDLAENNDGNFISLKDISKRQGISTKYAEQIVALLNKAGDLKTARGNNGGYKLARKPEQYTIGDILRASEGDLAPIMCLSEDGECNKKGDCKTLFFWEGLDKVINDYIDSVTLADFIKKEQ